MLIFMTAESLVRRSQLQIRQDEERSNGHFGFILPKNGRPFAINGRPFFVNGSPFFVKNKRFIKNIIPSYCRICNSTVRKTRFIASARIIGVRVICCGDAINRVSTKQP